MRGVRERGDGVTQLSGQLQGHRHERLSETLPLKTQDFHTATSAVLRKCRTTAWRYRKPHVCQRLDLGLVRQYWLLAQPWLIRRSADVILNRKSWSRPPKLTDLFGPKNQENMHLRRSCNLHTWSSNQPVICLQEEIHLDWFEQSHADSSMTNWKQPSEAIFRLVMPLKSFFLLNFQRGFDEESGWWQTQCSKTNQTTS